MTVQVVIPESYQHKRELERAQPDWSGSIRELLATPDPPHDRFPVVRYNTERVPLPKWLRVAVLKRDNFTCKCCGFQINPRLEIDHLIPWSAGGPDSSWNLRTLCYRCNQARSNWDTHDCDQRVLPIIGGCIDCLGRARGYNYDTDPDGWQEWADSYHGGSEQDEYAVAWCNRCQWFATSTYYEIDRSPFQAAAAQEAPVERPLPADAWWL